MPFTLIHGLVSFLAVVPFTKDWRLRIVAFGAGMTADLDGIPILFDTDLFYALHHELFHPLIYGIIFGLISAFALQKFAKMDFKKVFVASAFGYMLHPLTDVFFTDWPVKLFWPFSAAQYSWPAFIGFNGVLAIGAAVLSAIVLTIAAGMQETTGRRKINPYISGAKSRQRPEG